jgi:hypothetical protein
MTTAVRDDVRREVLKYVGGQASPVGIGVLAEELRKGNVKLSKLRDSEIRAIVQPMIVTGKLSYAPGLKIRLGKTKG